MKREKLFMGNGDASMARCYTLTADLFKAFSYLSAVQQARPETDEEKDELEQMEFFIEDTAQNIYTALTGKKFNGKGDLKKDTEKCKNKDENGKCPLHNLHCQYPACEK